MEIAKRSAVLVALLAIACSISSQPPARPVTAAWSMYRGDLTADGRELWSYDVHSAVRGGPALAGDLVAAGDLLGFRVSSS